MGLGPKSSDAPEAGYSHIQMGETCADGVHQVARFVEKPDAHRAVAMLAMGDHVWNAGVFRPKCWQPSLPH